MHRVLVSLGSNTCPAAHIRWASQRLSLLLDNARFSRTIWTEDTRGTGIFYMNQLASGYTALSADALQQALKAVEQETGRTKPSVTIDLDLIQYDQQRYHLTDWTRPYILQLMDCTYPCYNRP